MNGRFTKYIPSAKETEIGRLMSTLELDLGEENLNSTGQKLIDLQHPNLDVPSDLVQNALLL